MIVDPARAHRKRPRPLSQFARNRRIEREVSTRARRGAALRSVWLTALTSELRCTCPDCTAAGSTPTTVH